MNKDDLLREIERLRAEIYTLVSSGTATDSPEILRRSQELDRLTVLFHRISQDEGKTDTSHLATNAVTRYWERG